MKCLSICRSIHARSTTEKYGDLFSCRFSIRTRKWETTPGLLNIRHSVLPPSPPFFSNSLFSMLWIHRVLYRSRLFETKHLRKDRSSVDMISFPFSFFSFSFSIDSMPSYKCTRTRICTKIYLVSSFAEALLGSCKSVSALWLRVRIWRIVHRVG